jgi:hypothetical protein
MKAAMPHHRARRLNICVHSFLRRRIFTTLSQTFLPELVRTCQSPRSERAENAPLDRNKYNLRALGKAFIASPEAAGKRFSQREGY